MKKIIVLRAMQKQVKAKMEQKQTRRTAVEDC